MRDTFEPDLVHGRAELAAGVVRSHWAAVAVTEQQGVGVDREPLFQSSLDRFHCERRECAPPHRSRGLGVILTVGRLAFPADNRACDLHGRDRAAQIEVAQPGSRALLRSGLRCRGGLR